MLRERVRPSRPNANSKQGPFGNRIPTLSGTPVVLFPCLVSQIFHTTVQEVMQLKSAGLSRCPPYHNVVSIHILSLSLTLSLVSRSHVSVSAPSTAELLAHQNGAAVKEVRPEVHGLGLRVR